MNASAALAFRLPQLLPSNLALRSMVKPKPRYTPKRPMTAHTLRPATAADLPFLWNCLAIAAYEPLVGRAQMQPSLARYLKNWMRPNDFGLIASQDGKDIGAVWVRQFQLAEQPQVWVGPNVPELSVAVVPDYQTQGIGQSLLNALATEARQRNLRGLCLKVREENPAIQLYQRIGFQRMANSEIRNRAGGISFGMSLML